MAQSVEAILDELPIGSRPLTFILRDGRQVNGVFAGRDAETVRLERPSTEIRIEDIEDIVIEVVSEGPE